VLLFHFHLNITIYIKNLSFQSFLQF